VTKSSISLGAIQEALLLQKEVQSFLERWPAPPRQDDHLPQISWAQLERQIADLAPTPVKKQMVGPLISATRKQARFKPAELVMREILCIAGVLMDEGFDPPQPMEAAMS
jgi:hypothetical protein